jgi:outer membrane protein OmpA-like peptidoglycan-associated protein
MRTLLVAALLSLAWPALVSAQGSVQEPETRARGRSSWQIEPGVFGGVYRAPPDHELFDPDLWIGQPLQPLAPDFGLRLAIAPIPFLAIEGDASGVLNKTLEGSDRAFLFGLRAQLLVQIPWHLTPFALVGGGLVGVRSDMAVLGNDVDGEWHWGGGIKLPIRAGRGDSPPRVVLRLDYRMYWSAAEGAARTPGLHTEGLLGLSMVLGPGSDYGKALGSSSGKSGSGRDKDGDGLADREDGCPNEAEDLDGYSDADGCPDPDNDGDGIADEADDCPDEPELINNLDDNDGCPEFDTDDDGVIDDLDDCPYEAETYNGVEDNDGCPDQGLAMAVLGPDGRTIERIRVNQPVQFQAGTDVLLRGSIGVLDAVALAVDDHPQIRLLEIQGHTDSDGSMSANLDLSQRRAEAVLAYLVDLGMDPSLFVATGYGEVMPIADNNSAAGKAKNRRVDFVVLEQD